MCRNLRLRGDGLKLTYFQLLSSDPIYIPKVGGILSPKLKDISAISDNMYQYYLNILLMDLKMFFTMINRPDDYEKLTDEEKPYVEYQYLNRDLGHGVDTGNYNLTVPLPESYEFTDIK